MHTKTHDVQRDQRTLTSNYAEEKMKSQKDMKGSQHA